MARKSPGYATGVVASEPDSRGSGTMLVLEFGPADLGMRSEGPDWMRAREAVAALCKASGAPATRCDVDKYLRWEATRTRGALNLACRHGVLERSGPLQRHVFTAPPLAPDAPGLWADARNAEATP
jgi:hypothetical protein